MMSIKLLKKDSPETKSFYDMFIRSINDHEILHEALSFDEFTRKLFAQSDTITTFNLANENQDGFISVCIDENLKKQFITLIIVDKSKRRRGIGGELLKAAEDLMLKKQKINKFEISFYNPINFTWVIPFRKGVTHPNFPGLDVASDAYIFFKNKGYREFAEQNSYYVDLSGYTVPSYIKNLHKKLEESGYKFTYYDADVHTGMKEMIMSFESPIWERDILKEPSIKNGGRPIIVPIHNNTVCGFTGPLDLEKSGRGYFAGIGVSGAHRGKGIAKVLFSELCVGLKKLGAGYMTLFTGENNNARNIYEAAGFKIVKTWSDLRKTV